ncbi:mechanosensitive ion channel family protein [Thiohalophilus thiocyanatoxydans]|uniref:Small-conductance mechanosensitive channel n=1 Tax=Thiohalophilus thiocyanatoxydans TaxID=381308 RepID=A0A4R8IIV3_9GAMM|nr:mechanosensitive ion channel domain-containing protein [Thiohalophilus thiocyanatoxydans]TDY00611.1 small conductance mechanosensitive channel [Thiohalophilus thiocyanatoxydans]
MDDLINPEQVSIYTARAVELLMLYVPRFVLAIVVLLAGLWIISRVVKVMNKGMQRSKMEPTLAHFLQSLVSIGLKALLLISVASMVGIATTSFIAVLAAAGLAVGLALQGSLGNFAGGALILMFRPFKVGDYITAQGVSGTVTEMQIFNTILTTPDNVRIIVPNGALSNGTITNFSAETTRRLDFVFGIDYRDDIARAREVIMSIMADEEKIFNVPEPQVLLSNLGDSAVELTVRAWVYADDYWPLKFELTEKVKAAFDREGIRIPFPQRELHVYQSTG